MGSTLKIQGLTVVEAIGGPLHVEYALFDPEERELGRNAIGAVVELGFRTTVRAARARLAQLGATNELASTFARMMAPSLSAAFARGPVVRRIVGLLEPRMLLEANRYDAAAGVYEGLFLDLAAIEAELGRKGTTVVFQALFLAALLAASDENAVVGLSSHELAATMKAGAHAYQRVTLDRLPELPAGLAELTSRRGGRGARGTVLGEAKVVELLRARFVGGPKLAACLQALEAAREMPKTGALAQPALWEIELLLDAGNHAAGSQKLVALERKGGRTPATTYLRARLDLLTRVEPPEVLARRIATLAQAPTAFPELVLLASEAWLSAGNEARAQEYASQVLDNAGISETLRERAAVVLQSTGAAPAPRPKPPTFPPEARRSTFPDPRTEAGAAKSRSPAPDPRAEVDADQRKSKGPPPIPNAVRRDAVAFVAPAVPPSSVPPASVVPKARITERPAIPRVEERDVVTARPIERSIPFGPWGDDLFGARGPSERGARPPSEPPAVDGASRGSVSGPPTTALTPPQGNLATAVVQVPPLRDDGAMPPISPTRSPPPPKSALADSRPPSLSPSSGHDSGKFDPQDALGGSRPPSVRDVAPPWFSYAPPLPRVDPAAVELAEELALPLPQSLAGLVPGLRAGDDLPRSVLEARIQFTLLSRELGRTYRTTRNVALRADLSGIELMQAYLVDRFASGQVDGPDGAREVRLHGAFLSEILARRLGGEWIDIRDERLGHWEMMVAPGTHVWPFGRVARFIGKGHRERDLVAYFLELQTHALLSASGR